LKLGEAMKAGRAVLCGIDTWILNKFKNFNKFEKFEAITDISCISTTGFYDPFSLDFLTFNLKACGLKRRDMPRIVDNSFNFGYIHKDVLGAPVRVATIIGDQSASLIGNACFRKMDAKITLGTGVFLTINTGRRCLGSKNGANPFVSWSLRTIKKDARPVFNSERMFSDSSTLINFAKTVGLCDDIKDLSHIAASVANTNGVIFIPNFHSLSGFMGYKQSTTKSHLVRAVLESIVFKVAEFYFHMKEEINYHYDKIRIDGGIAANDFVCQSIADLLNINIERSVTCELTAIGCAYLGAFNCGKLEELEHAAQYYKIDKLFVPNACNRKELFMRYKRYEELNSAYK
jgi:putative glycerol kinase 5